MVNILYFITVVSPVEESYDFNQEEPPTAPAPSKLLQECIIIIIRGVYPMLLYIGSMYMSL